MTVQAVPMLLTPQETSSWARRIDARLKEFEQAGLGAFARPDMSGAVHNLALSSTEPSHSNTAAVFRTATLYQQFAKGLDRSILDQWKKDPLDVRIGELKKDLDPTRASDQAKQGDELIYLLFSTIKERAEIPTVLERWIEQYCTDWIVRRWYRTPSVRHLYIATELFAIGSTDGEPQWSKDTERAVRAAAEQIVWRQVAFASSKLWTHFDAVELALATYLAYTASFPAEVLEQAAQHLNDAAARDKTWTSRDPTLSAFYACHALLGPSRASARLRRLVSSAIFSHLRWALDSEPTRDWPWYPPDLHDRYPAPEPWFNCLLLEVLCRARSWLNDSTRGLVLDSYGGRRVEPKVSWERLLLNPEDLDALTRAFISPISSGGGKAPNNLKHCTAILFGPPGTAKTTVAEALAKKVDWPLVEIGVAHFLKDGLDRVFARAVEIFHDLSLLERAVVLLDEVEAVFARREDSDLRQRFLTSALLPPLHELSDKKAIILLIATNHISEFDAAVSRPGRIDLIIPVGPPDQNGRKRLLEEVCKLPSPVAETLAGMMSDGLTIGEILTVKEIAAVTSDTSAIFKKWHDLHGDRNLIDADALLEFQRQTKLYRRGV